MVIGKAYPNALGAFRILDDDESSQVLIKIIRNHLFMCYFQLDKTYSRSPGDAGQGESTH